MITRILSFLIVSAICIGLIGCNNTQEPTVEVTTANAITTENQGHSDWVYFKECPTLPEPSSIVDLLFIGESCVTYTSSDGDWKIHTYSYGKKQPSDAMDLILERYLHTIQECFSP